LIANDLWLKITAAGKPPPHTRLLRNPMLFDLRRLESRRPTPAPSATLMLFDLRRLESRRPIIP